MRRQMKFIRLFAVEIRRIMLNPLYAAMVIFTLAFTYIGNYSDIRTTRFDAYNTLDVLYILMLARQSLYSTIGVLICAVASSHSFADDFESKYFNFTVARIGKNKYVAAKFLAVAIAGGLVLAIGETLFILILRTRLPLVAENSSALQSLTSTSAFLAKLLEDGHNVLFFALTVMISFLYGALWSAVGLATSAFIPNKFIAAFSPYIILQFNEAIFKGTLRAIVIFRGNYTFGTFGASMAYTLGFFALLIIACAVLFRIGAMRRVQS